MSLNKNFFENNFDLIRFYAASQVVLFNHYAKYFDISICQNTVFSSLSGVPLFFFISGFLISSSFERKSNILEYSQNRVLRIFPALWVCLLISLLLLFISGYPLVQDLKQFLFWIFTQLWFPVYNPDFMRDYGTGVLNGSLWTIPVELQFYIIIPFLYYAFKKIGISSRDNKLSFIFLILSISFYLIKVGIYQISLFENESLMAKLYGVSFIPHIYIFFIGCFYQRNFDFFYKYLSNKFIYFLILHITFYSLLKYFNQEPSLIKGLWQFPLAITMSFVVFSAAYSYKNLAKKLLKGNDISYGIYIYHIPIANYIIYTYGNNNNYVNFIIGVCFTYLIAYISWKVIEMPSLSLKRHPLNPIKKILSK